MGISRAEAIERIESQRDTIREHIEKYERYVEDYDKEYALKTIRNCQGRIEHIKDRCSSELDYSYEDDWRP